MGPEVPTNRKKYPFSKRKRPIHSLTQCLKPQFKAWKLTDWSLVMLLKLVKSKVHSRVKSSVAELSNRSLGSNVLDKYASWQLEPLSKGRQWRIWHNKTQHMLWTIFSPWMLMEDSPFFTSSEIVAGEFCFEKKSKWPFLEKLWCIFSENVRNKPYIKVQNLQHKFLDWKWPPPPFESFPKFHPFW